MFAGGGKFGNIGAVLPDAAGLLEGGDEFFPVPTTAVEVFVECGADDVAEGESGFGGDAGGFCVLLVFGSVSVTVAPATTAPVGSLTTPRTLPVVC